MLTFEHLHNWGRLGNQMFKYAALKGIATNNLLSFAIPPVDKQDPFAYQYQLLDNFKLPGVVVSNEINTVSVQEASFAFDRDLFNMCPDNVNLEGGFQSYKYFEHIEEEIRKDFEFRHRFSKPKYPYVAIHVRRGDYLKDPDHHPTCSVDYYAEAMAKFPKNTNFIILSDDILWCAEQDVFKNCQYWFSDNNIEDLFIMTQADHNIIANSTFSWWGSWLNNKMHRTIAPKQWFGKALSYHDTSDLLPPEWETL